MSSRMCNLTVSEWNDEIVNSLIPNIFVLSVYIVAGICGNVVVLMVYAIQMRAISDERFFIPVLAVFDLIATLYLGSFSIYSCLNQIVFSSDTLCKTTSFFFGLATFVPIFILLIIAVQRYLKVCVPRKGSMSLLLKRVLVLLAIFISLLITLPIPFVYEVKPVYNTIYDIIGRKCAKSKTSNSLARNIYGIVVGMFALVVTITLIVLYSRIAYTIFHNLNMNKDLNSETENKICETSISLQDGEITKPATVPVVHSYYDEHAHANISSATTSKKSGSKQLRKNNRRLTFKLTTMFLVITLVFLFSYTPIVVLLITEGVSENLWDNLSTSQRSGVMFAHDLYIINNIVNPFIYAFMDTKFRSETMNFLSRVFRPCKL
ncbi:cholecystokinin receptor-like [Mytilus californianus]|uniref:cholecystokinin receptor-like n=1 Tax=Mytilus californianus TaxID=6549 RepID=UPI00224707B3|nr:cholecystokinin receptor-like [Mytilus californianus]